MHPIADRQQLAVGVEQKAVAHFERHRPRGRFEGREARRQSSGRVRRLIDVTPMALDRAAHRLHPEQHVRAGVVAPFARECGRDVGHGLGLRGEVRQSFRDALTVHVAPVARRRRARRACRRAGARSRSGFVARRATGPLLRARGRARRRCRPGAARTLASGRSTPGRRWRARSGGRPGCRCRPWRRTADRAGADRCVSYQL